MNETRDASCPEPETPKNESKLDDSIQKFDEVVRDLPPIYVNRSNTAKGLLHAMFRPDILKRRFKNNGIRMLRGSLLMPNTAKYVYAAEKLVSIVVPNTPVATFMKGVRNAVFLDQFVGDIVPKIEFAGGMNVRDKLHKVFGTTASAPTWCRTGCAPRSASTGRPCTPPCAPACATTPTRTTWAGSTTPTTPSSTARPRS